MELTVISSGFIRFKVLMWFYEVLSIKDRKCNRYMMVDGLM